MPPSRLIHRSLHCGQGSSGFFRSRIKDASLGIHYGYLQMLMASGPLLPPPGSPGPAIFVEYSVWQTDANVPLTTSVVPEPASAALVGIGGIAILLGVKRRRGLRHAS